MSTLLVMYVISPKLSPYFVNTKKPFCDDWHSKVAEIPFAIALSSVSFYALFLDDTVTRVPIWGSTALVPVASGLVCGCMLADFFYDIITGLMQMDYALHHFISTTYCLTLLLSGAYSYYLFLLGITEVTTIFLNLNWMLKFLGFEKTSTPYVFNAVAYTATSFLVRVVPVPYGWYLLLYVYPNVVPQPHIIVTAILWFDLFIMNALNIYWFYYQVIGLKKILSKYTITAKGGKMDISL